MAKTITEKSFLINCPEHLKAISATVAMNMTDRLYVISEAGGVSCLGFTNCWERVQRLEEWLTMTPSETQKDGVPVETYWSGLYLRYQDLMRTASLKYDNDSIKCPCELTPQLIGKEHKRVEVETTYGETKRFWVGKSSGWMPIHLEIPYRRSTGGPGADREYKSVRVVEG